jgi:hypothetical protein
MNKLIDEVLEELRDKTPVDFTDDIYNAALLKFAERLKYKVKENNIDLL